MKAKYSINKAIIKLLATFLLAGCVLPLVEVQDTTSPGAGGNGVISVANRTSTSLTLVWQKGNDNKSPQSELLYKVIESQNPDIDTIEGAESALIVLLDWTQNVTSVDVSGLTLDATYYFNVILKDESGHTTLYTMLGITMTEKDPPIPGNTGFIDTTYPKATEQEIVWSKATDIVDAQNQLQYKLVRSLSPDIETVADIETLGHGTVLMNWIADMSSFPDTNLTKATNYYYNVLVRDTALNTGIYTMALLRTPIPESEVFVFSPGDTLAEHGFTGINLMEPITADGYILTSSEIGDQYMDYISEFTTPQFSDMNRNAGGGVEIEWKVKYLSADPADYASANSIRIQLLDKDDSVLYTLQWEPVPDESDRNIINRRIYLGDSTLLVSSAEQLIFPSGLNTPKWVSHRIVINSNRIYAWNDLTADLTTTDGNPNWNAITTADIVSTNSDNNHFSKIRFEYRHYRDNDVLVRDFSITTLPPIP